VRRTLQNYTFPYIGNAIVRLPFKNGLPISIGKSRFIAASSFRHLEQRLIRDIIIASEYREFLAGYETLSHMTKNPPTEVVKPKQTYYILRLT